jgi:hypothetical protein
MIKSIKHSAADFVGTYPNIDCAPKPFSYKSKVHWIRRDVPATP